jgi:hypothetical protein
MGCPHLGGTLFSKAEGDFEMAKNDAPEVEVQLFNDDFEDEKPERFVFQLREHHAGRTLGIGVEVDENARVTLVGTRSQVAGRARNLQRYYNAVLVK